MDIFVSLSELTKILRERTSVEAGSPIGIDISKDDISFYPIIYWPIVSDKNILSDETIKKIQLYMKNGGLILFDTRDQSPNNIISKNISQEQIYLKNDTNNVIEFNSSFSEEIKANQKRNFWNLLKIK